MTEAQAMLRLAFGLSLACAACSPGAVHEETFTLYLDGKSFSNLVKAADASSGQQGYEITQQTLQVSGPKTANHILLLEGSGVRSLIQSALAEKCIAREGMRDVEYSPTVMDVTSFSPSVLTPASKVKARSEELKRVLTRAGFRVVSEKESCKLL